MNKEIKNQKGITLIALIITIIVLIILVAVTVTVALEGGLFNNAKDAARETEKHAIYETVVSAMELDDNQYIDYVLTANKAKIALENDEKTVDSIEIEENNIPPRAILTVTGKYGTYQIEINGKEIKFLDDSNPAGGGGGDSIVPDKLRKYILGEEEEGIIPFTEMNPDSGIISYMNHEFIGNSTIEDADEELHFVTMGSDNEYGYMYIKYDEDGKYYKVTLDKDEFKTLELDEIYTPTENENIGKILEYDDKRYTVISATSGEYELVANYVYEGFTLGADSYADALSSYNNSIDSLNSAAVTATGLGNDANVTNIRSVGNSGINDDPNTFDGFSVKSPEIFTAYIDKSAKKADTNYETDICKLYEANALSATKKYWIASRDIAEDPNILYFYVRYFDMSDFTVSSDIICEVLSDGNTQSYEITWLGVRPIIYLKTGASGITWITE